MNTIVEFFDIDPLENIISLLMLNPSKVIFVGSSPLLNETSKAMVEAFLNKKLPLLQIEYIEIERYNLQNTISRLTELYNNNKSCIFDLTGGKELFLVSAGIVATANKIPMFQINIKQSKFLPIYKCENISAKATPVLTVPELVSLYGGAVNENKQESFKNSFSKEVFADIFNLWSIAKIQPTKWNYQMKAFEDIVKLNASKGDINKVSFNLKEINPKFTDAFSNSMVLTSLIENGYITSYSQNEEQYIHFSFKNDFTRCCLTEAGSILELYTFSCVNQLKDYYSSYMVGVPIDWDCHRTKSFADTTNEMDLILTKGVVPVFISCKNGMFEKEALYELDVVASRFGGRHVKKVLVASMPPDNTPRYEYLKQRAKEMNIILIDGVSKMEPEDFKNLLKEII